MNTLANDIQEKNLLTFEDTKWRNLYLALERLRENKDFKHLILDGYFRERAIDAVSMLAHPNTISNGTRPQLMEDLVAISRLESYFATIDFLGAPRPEEDDDSLEQNTTE